MLDSGLGGGKIKIPSCGELKPSLKSDPEETEPGVYSSPTNIVSFAEVVLQKVFNLNVAQKKSSETLKLFENKIVFLHSCIILTPLLISYSC